MQNPKPDKPSPDAAPADQTPDAPYMMDGEEPLAPQEPAAAPADSQQAAALQAEIDRTKDQMLRALADAENTRKRALKERDDAMRYSIANFARDMLTIADNLRRALDSAPADLMESEPRFKNVIDGVEATERELLKSFEKQGIRKIDPMDEPFNPNYHEVMFETPGTGKPAGTVVQVVEIGYILHDRLLRPARVGVAKDEGQGGPGAPPGATIDTQV